MNQNTHQRLQKGATYLKEGLYEDAVEAFTACLAVDPREVQALHGRATAQFHLKLWGPAEADFIAARALDPEDTALWSGLALTLAMQNKIYPALELFEGLLARHPNNIQAHIQMGLLHFKLVAVAKGRDYLEKALTLRPTLAQRQLIEKALKEQGILDQKRFYRPDFERLNRQKASPGGSFAGKIISFLRRKHS